VDSKWVLAFDFDGVICDSVYECYIQAIAAYKKIGFQIEPTKKLEKQFRECRPFVLHGEDYVAFFKIIEENPNADFSKMNQDEFEIYNSNRDFN